MKLIINVGNYFKNRTLFKNLIQALSVNHYNGNLGIIHYLKITASYTLKVDNSALSGVIARISEVSVWLRAVF